MLFSLCPKVHIEWIDSFQKKKKLKILLCNYGYWFPIHLFISVDLLKQGYRSRRIEFTLNLKVEFVIYYIVLYLHIFIYFYNLPIWILILIFWSSCYSLCDLMFLTTPLVDICVKLKTQFIGAYIKYQFLKRWVHQILIIV